MAAFTKVRQQWVSLSLGFALLAGCDDGQAASSDAAQNMVLARAAIISTFLVSQAVVETAAPASMRQAVAVAAGGDGEPPTDATEDAANANADDAASEDPAADEAKADEAKGDEDKADEDKADEDKADDDQADEAKGDEDKADEAKGDDADASAEDAGEGNDDAAEDADEGDDETDDGDDKSDDDEGDDDKAAKAKAKQEAAAERRRLIAAKKAKGRGVYMKKCKSCHGASGAADTGIGKKTGMTSWKTRGWRRKWSVNRIKGIVRSGKPGTKMRAFSGKLSADEIEAVSIFAHSLGR